MKKDELEETRLRRLASYLRARGRHVDEHGRAAAVRALRMSGEFGPLDLACRCRMEAAEVGVSTAWYTLDQLVAAGVAISSRPLRNGREFPRWSRYRILSED